MKKFLISISFLLLTPALLGFEFLEKEFSNFKKRQCGQTITPDLELEFLANENDKINQKIQSIRVDAEKRGIDYDLAWETFSSQYQHPSIFNDFDYEAYLKAHPPSPMITEPDKDTLIKVYKNTLLLE